MNEVVLGHGIDLVECQRIAESLKNFGERFLDRIYLPSERIYAAGHVNSLPHYAARFAAKEAVSKAFGTGIGEEIGWKDIEVLRHLNGQPSIQLLGNGATLFKKKKGLRILISLTHTEHYAMASVLLIGVTETD